MNNELNTVGGYARVTTDCEGKILHVKEWYNYDKKLHSYLTKFKFNDWISHVNHKDSEVLIKYNYYKSRYWVGCGYENGDGLNICDIIVMNENYNKNTN